MDTPKTVEIDPKLHKKLMEANSRMEAVQKMMQMFQSTCEERMAAIQREVRETWGEIAQSTGIDMRNIVWEPHPSQPIVVPTQMKLNVG
jgi:hypothetical protein